MTINIGTQFGSHEIIGLLGKGGMGEVYRARDAKLKREVAIKILPDEFSCDPDRRNRFQHEPEVLASLTQTSRPSTISRKLMARASSCSNLSKARPWLNASAVGRS